MTKDVGWWHYAKILLGLQSSITYMTKQPHSPIFTFYNGSSLTHILPYKDRIQSYIRENAGQRKTLYWRIFHSVYMTKMCLRIIGLTWHRVKLSWNHPWIIPPLNQVSCMKYLWFKFYVRNTFKHIIEGLKCWKHINILTHLFPNAPFFYLLKTSENLTIFWFFQGVEEGCIGKKWVKNFF